MRRRPRSSLSRGGRRGERPRAGRRRHGPRLQEPRGSTTGPVGCPLPTATPRSASQRRLATPPVCDVVLHVCSRKPVDGGGQRARGWRRHWTVGSTACRRSAHGARQWGTDCRDPGWRALPLGRTHARSRAEGKQNAQIPRIGFGLSVVCGVMGLGGVVGAVAEGWIKKKRAFRVGSAFFVVVFLVGFCRATSDNAAEGTYVPGRWQRKARLRYLRNPSHCAQ